MLSTRRWISFALAVLLLTASAQSSSAAVNAADLLANLHADANDLAGWLQHHRRHLHTIPELAFEEAKTAAYIRAELEALGIPFRHGIGGTDGIVATLGSGQPVFALRADIDALPIEELNDVEYKSTHQGRMHACGHDVHITMLLGAARLLKAREGSLRGTVRLLFQPAEESRGGALDMIAGGAMDGVAAIAGLHVWPDAPSGTITTKDRTIMAASDRFNITVIGSGGHAGLPHRTKDPVVAAAALVGALQPLVARETAPTDGAVVSVSRFNTGPGASNVIPGSVEMLGTIRALTPAHFQRLRRRVAEVADLTARAHGCTAEVAWSARPYRPTVNDAAMVDLVSGVASQLSRFEPLAEPSMAAEDFSFYSDKAPAVFTFLGIRNESAGSVYALHNPRFTMDESQMPLGAALHAATALTYLERAAAKAATAAASRTVDEL